MPADASSPAHSPPRHPSSTCGPRGTWGWAAAPSTDLRYDAEGRLEQLGRWWRESPGWQGPVTLQGQVRGPLKRPEATIAAKGTDLRWATLQRAALDATGQVSIEGLVLNALSLTLPQGRLEGSGRFTFRQQGQSEVDARWRDVDGTVITGLVPLTAGDLPRAHLSGSATLTWSGRLPTATTTEGKLDTTAIAVAPETNATATLVANGRAGRWQVNVQQTLDGIADAALDGVVVAAPGQLTRSPVSGSIVVHADNPRATLAQLQRLGVPLPQAVSAMDASIFAAEGTLTGSLGAPRATLRVGLNGMRAGELSDINVVGKRHSRHHGDCGVHHGLARHGWRGDPRRRTAVVGSYGPGPGCRACSGNRGACLRSPAVVAARWIARGDRRMDRLGSESRLDGSLFWTESRIERSAPRRGIRGPCAGRWPRLGEEPEGFAV